MNRTAVEKDLLPILQLVRRRQPYPERTPGQRRLYEFAKRALDIVGASLFFIVAFPLLLLCACAIKATSRGPVLFKQRRLGRDGRVFWCYKLRTMVVDAEEQLKRNAALQAQFQARYKIENDPRITPIGGFLRKTSLDELPQFFNVLLGDMTLIGPRPIVPPELEKYGPFGSRLLQVKPGLGGLWQAGGRSDTSYEERIQLDMLYVEHRSFWLDVQLLLLTAAAVLRKTGAH